jgi:Na+/H+ antiporter NhaD/arsenite permease-like protein
MLAPIVASVIFIAAIVLILTERLDRTIVAITGAALMVGLGAWMGFYGEEAAVAAIDFETLGLLFGMMVLVALLKPTGFFEYLATLAASRSRGNPVLLLILLGSVTTVLSMFLDNVTTVVLIAPVTILVSEILGISPVPFLISEALLSNTGGVATLIGDPPNVLIASAADLSFNDFLVHALPVVVFAWPAALGLLLVLFRGELSRSPRHPEVVRGLIPGEALHDKRTALKLVFVLAAALVLFLLQETLRLTPSFIALSMAAVALVWIRPPVEKTLDEIEWSVLVFFVGLFVMVGGLEAAGALEVVTQVTARVTSGDPVLGAVAIVWVVAVLSALVDNVPITVAMLPVIQELGAQGVEVGALWWAVAFGAGFGGNGTIIGSTANVVVAGLSRRTRHPITSPLWNRRGLPVMILTTAIASLAVALAFPLFAR